MLEAAESLGYTAPRREGRPPVVTVPRVAVLSDQQGNFVYIVDAEKKVQPRRVTLGQSTPSLAAIATGLQDGDTVVLRGWCAKPGAARVGFGECRGQVLPARAR